MAEPGNGQVTLAWVSGGSGSTAIDRWEYRQTTGHTRSNDHISWEGWTPIPDSGAATTSHTVTKLADDTALINGTTYLFEVRAHNLGGAGEASHTVYATAGAPPAPRRLAATPGNGQVRLTWTSGGDNGSGIHCWEYRQTTDNVFLAETWKTITSLEYVDVSIFSFTVTGLPNGTAHLFQVRAVNFRGNGVPSAVVSATPGGGGGGGGDDPSPTPPPPTQPPVNRSPEFTDGSTADRSIAENTPAATGQLLTKTPLDYEAKAAYSVEVTAADTSGASATITVTITVTDVALPGKGGDYDADDNDMIDIDEVNAAIDDYFNGQLTLAEVSAVIDLYFAG